MRMLVRMPLRMPGTKDGSRHTFSAERRLRPGSAGQLLSNLVGVVNDVGIAGMARRHALVSPPSARVVMHTCVLSMCMAPGLLSATGPVQEASGAGAKRRGSNARHQAATAFVASGLVREGSPCGGTGRNILAHSLPPHRSLGPRLGRCLRKDVLAGSLQHGGEATGAEACAWELGPVQPEARQCRRAHEIAQQEYVDSLKGIIRVNKLDAADDAVLRDEPLRFYVGAESPEDADRVREEIAELQKSGEWAELVKRMRLD